MIRNLDANPEDANPEDAYPGGFVVMSAVDPRHGLKVGTSSSAGTSYELVLGLAVHEGTAIAVGGQGRDLFRLSLDGNTFRNGVSPGPGLRGALLRDDGLWVAGEYGYLARSLDRGRTWQRLATKTKGCLFGVVADGAGRLWVAGDDGYLAMSTDGERFRRVKGIAESIARISDSPLGVLVPTDAPGYLYVCDGTSVERLGVEAGVDLMSATVTPTGSVLTVGAKGAVHRSGDGREFERVPVPTKELLTSVRCLPDGRVVVVGANGVILVSGDDGRSFAALEQFAAAGTFWCCEPYGDTLLIGGEKGLVAWLGERRPEPPPVKPIVLPEPEPEAVANPVWAAPSRSTTEQDWRPPAPEPVELRDGVYVDPWLLGALYPRRGGIATPIRPLPTVDEAWAALRRALWAADRHGMMTNNSRSGIWTLASSDDDRDRRLGERILDPAPRTGTAEDDAALVSLTMQRYNSFVVAFNDEVFDRTADFLVASVGLTEALRRSFVGLDDELPYVGVGPFGRLRELLVLADEASYVEARTAILETCDAELERDPTDRDRCADLRWAATFLLPLGPQSGDVERAAHQEAMRHVGKFGNDRVHACGIAAGDLDTLRRFLGANRDVAHQFFSPFRQGRMYLASVLELAGGAAADVLATMKPGSPWTKDPYHNGLWSQLLARAAGEPALVALHGERRAGFPWGTAGLLLAASFDPERVRRFALDQGDEELAKLVDSATEPEPPRAPAGDDLVLGDLMTPVPYSPPPARHGGRLDTPLVVEPEQDWRDEEVERARNAYLYEESVKWNGVSVGRCDPSEVDAFVAHRERWAVPTTLDCLTLAPARVHDRLMALGFEIGDYDARRVLLLLMHRGGQTHLPLLLAALDEPTAVEYALEAAQPFGDVAIVPAVAKAFAGKKHKVLARSWILRHPRHAAAGAVTLWTNDRDDAGAARVLRYLDAQGHRPTVLEFAGALGTEEPIRALLDEDPLAAPRAKQPVLPSFADPRQLPRLDGATDEEIAVLLAQLAYSNADEVHPGVLAARTRYSAASRAAFVWALFEAWLAAGAQPSWTWCMQAVGFLGDDDCARRLAALARKWPGVNASARAQAALDALLNIGTDTALININLLAEKSRFPAFAAAARERIDAIAYARGLTADELADRLVPTLGLDEEGADVIDTGTHKYRIAFDANLVPILRDERGALLTDLPKPGKADDKERVKEAKARLSALRKDARASASLHLSRIERAMCTGRAIDAEVFLDRYARHPWMRHLAARLVWGLAGEASVSFRVAEDGTLADLDENRYELPPTAAVVVRHPLDLAPDALTAWSEVFADYEILQPFPQLSRPVFRPADTPDPVVNVRGRTVTYGQLRGLEARGWERWYDASVQMSKRLGGKLWAVLETDPGWHPSDTVDSVEPQRIEGLRFFGGDPAELDVRTYSELVYDIQLLS